LTAGVVVQAYPIAEENRGHVEIDLVDESAL